jgi:hypothetical protein
MKGIFLKVKDKHRTILTRFLATDLLKRKIPTPIATAKVPKIGHNRVVCKTKST